MPHRDVPPFRRRSVHLSLPQTLLGKILAVVLALTLGVAALAVSLVLLAIGIAIGLLVWLWFLWRMRGIRRQMSAQSAAGVPPGAAAWPTPGEAVRPPSGRVIEGEFLRAGEDAAPPASDKPGGDGGNQDGRPPPA